MIRIFLAFFVLCLSAEAFAQYTVVDDKMALALMPELKDAHAPDWVKPGMRFVYHRSDATVPGSGMILVLDENGDWVVKGTDQKVSVAENPGGGGHGILVVDVIAVQEDAVVVSVRDYLINGVPTGPVTLSTMNGYVTMPGALNEVYVQPEVLKKYANINEGGVTSRPVRYKAAGKTYDAIWRQTITEGGSTTCVFDPASGQILHTAMCVSNGGQLVTLGGQTQVSGGNTGLAQSTLEEVRQIKVPWKQGKLPAVLQDVKKLNYAGSMQGRLPNGMAMPPFSIVSSLRIVGRGDDFIQFERNGSMTIGTSSQDLGKTNFVSGPAQLLPAAIDPDDLAALKKGQVIDEDPYTTAKVSVIYVGRDSGHDVVVLSEQFAGGNNNLRADMVYDRNTGLCIGTSSTNVVLHQLTKVSLTSQQ